MRILRLSFLRQYFLLSKNIKKALLIINIGIFLSIFAATSAAISFYIEKKINEKTISIRVYEPDARMGQKLNIINFFKFYPKCFEIY